MIFIRFTLTSEQRPQTCFTYLPAASLWRLQKLKSITADAKQSCSARTPTGRRRRVQRNTAGTSRTRPGAWRHPWRGFGFPLCLGHWLKGRRLRGKCPHFSRKTSAGSENSYFLIKKKEILYQNFISHGALRHRFTCWHPCRLVLTLVRMNAAPGRVNLFRPTNHRNRAANGS